MGLPLYTTETWTDLSDQGRSAYLQFDKARVFCQVMRQAGNTPEQIQFRSTLIRLRDAEVTVDDWSYLIKQMPTIVQDMSSFANALHLYPTVAAVAEHNDAKMRELSQHTATIKVVHIGASVAKATSDDAGGLEVNVCIAKSVQVMLISNLWVDMELVNGAIGTVRAICYQTGGPPDLSLAVMVMFDKYCGPTLHDGTIPVTPIRHSWSSSGVQCLRLQIPLKLAWPVTIHKSQGLTLNKIVVDIGKREFSSGLTFLACSRVCQLKDLLLHPAVSFKG